MNLKNLQKNLQLTGSFSNDDLEKLAAFIEPKILQKKKFLFQQNEIARYVGFVNKGCLRYFFIDNSGHEHIHYFATEGWWVGDLNSFYMNEPTPNNLQALEDCELFLFSLSSFEGARKSIPAFDKIVAIKHRKAYTATQQRSIESKAASAEEKYINLIQSSPGLLQRVPQHYIASYLGITPVSLSRIRKKISGH